jgi:hypothetical protein
MSNRVGTICLTSNQGLSYLVKDFYDNGIITDVLVQKHPRFKNNPVWYGKESCDLDVYSGYPFTNNAPSHILEKIETFLDNIDVLFLFETPFYMQALLIAKQKNIPIVFMPMYECTPYPIHCDVYLSPSDLDYKYNSTLYKDKKNIRINVPVPNEVKWKERKVAKTFIHNSGNGGTYGRNGTAELIEAMKYVNSPIELIIRSQTKDFSCEDPRVKVYNKHIPFEQLWSTGDVFIFPEKFNGLSLPIQEAFSSGLCIMCGNRMPMNNWLPKELLINVSSYEKKNIVNIKFDSAIFDPKDIAKSIDEWYNKDISHFSNQGKKWLSENNWQTLGPEYHNILKGL